ncbi:MAG: AI-2E family transporter [Chloroflexi bacterium]|nr:AI-2E family transporter [Chloroflexota bacterium]
MTTAPNSSPFSGAPRAGVSDAPLPADEPSLSAHFDLPPSADQGVALPGRGLMDRDWQKLLIVFLTVLAGLALTWVLWQVLSPISHTLVLFGLAAVLAFALSGPVNMLTAHIGHRLVSIVAVYLLVGTVVVGGLTLLAGPFVRDATALSGALPQYAADLQARAPEVQSTLGSYGIQADLDQLKVRAAAAVEQGGSEVLKNLVGTLAEVGGIILDVVLALVISLYLLIDGPRFRVRTLALVPAQHRAKALFLEDHVSRVLGGYLRGQLTLAAIIGVAAGVGTGLLGLPYAVVLGVLAGLFELVPMFGPILSVVPAVIVALFMPFPTVVWVLLFFLAIQQVENNILAPRISGHAVGLHPLGAMFALLAGFQLAGLLGGLFAVPLAGVLWVLLGAAYRNAVASPTPVRRWGLPRWQHGVPLPRRAALESKGQREVSR